MNRRIALKHDILEEGIKFLNKTLISIVVDLALVHAHSLQNVRADEPQCCPHPHITTLLTDRLKWLLAYLRLKIRMSRWIILCDGSVPILMPAPL